MDLQILFGLIIALAAAIWVGSDANKRGMNGGLWGIGVFMLLIIFLPLYFAVRKPLLIREGSNVQNDVNNLVNPELNQPPNIAIPDICPHCKNPNPKRIRLCEWCGNQIC